MFSLKRCLKRSFRLTEVQLDPRYCVFASCCRVCGCDRLPQVDDAHQVGRLRLLVQHRAVAGGHRLVLADLGMSPQGAISAYRWAEPGTVLLFGKRLSKVKAPACADAFGEIFKCQSFRRAVFNSSIVWYRFAVGSWANWRPSSMARAVSRR